eukprot:TRINITY_DN5919_c0_g1_i1.p1 TRINITY_DN5919_c0_g1~~TRINITY_DN5919_c0_g1_i1.p1  ORF type:complete len:208 (-),score=24.94 TRINITY_DN5919_c0_g1_i1:28-651(-)
MDTILDDILLYHILPLLSPSHLNLMVYVSHRFNTLCDTYTLWHHHCAHLWKDKIRHPSLTITPESKSTKSYWRHAYFNSLIDAQRTLITYEELCGTYWELYLTNNDHSDHNAVFLVFEEIQVMFLPGFPLMRWMIGRTTNGSYGLQVEEFPAMIFSRSEDWGWAFENMYGKYVMPQYDNHHITQQLKDLFFSLLQANVDDQGGIEDE